MKHSHEASPETFSPILSHFTLSSSSFVSKESARRVCAQVSQDMFSKRYPGTTVGTRSHSRHLTAPYNDRDKKPLSPSLVPHPVGQEPEASQRRAALERKTPGKLTCHRGQWHLLCFGHNQRIRRAASGRCPELGGNFLQRGAPSDQPIPYLPPLIFKAAFLSANPWAGWWVWPSVTRDFDSLPSVPQSLIQWFQS